MFFLKRIIQYDSILVMLTYNIHIIIDFKNYLKYLINITIIYLYLHNISYLQLKLKNIVFFSIFLKHNFY